MVTLVTSGSWMSCGRSARMRLTAARVSSSAPGRSVESWNSIAVVLTPSVTVEVTRLTPSSVATWSSTLRVTSVSNWLGDAPGWLMVTTTIGKLMSGKRATGSFQNPYRPATHSW
jgi:hypothetical protein